MDVLSFREVFSDFWKMIRIRRGGETNVGDQVSHFLFFSFLFFFAIIHKIKGIVDYIERGLVNPDFIQVGTTSYSRWYV